MAETRAKCQARPVIRQEGDKLIVTIDISPAALKAGVPSASGKSHTLCTTGGLVPVLGTPVRMNLTVTD